MEGSSQHLKFNFYKYIERKIKNFQLTHLRVDLVNRTETRTSSWAVIANIFNPNNGEAEAGIAL